MRGPDTVEKTVEEIIEDTMEKTVEEIIVKLIEAKSNTTTKEMMIATGLTRRGIEYQLSRLQEIGKINRIGPDKGGYWKLN